MVLVERLAGHQFAGLLKQPARWGHWPALILYWGFINLELFGHLLSRELSAWLLAYSVVNIAGAWLFGRQAWFEQGEFFGVMLRLIGRMAPLTRSHGRFRLRMPFSGLLEGEPKDMGLVLFVLFTLHRPLSTGCTRRGLLCTCIGLKSTRTSWAGGASRLESKTPSQSFCTRSGSDCVLLPPPFIYLALFAAILVAMDAIVRSGLTVRELLFKFALCLVPIAFVYHVTHYFTLLFAQGGQTIRLVSDPLGVGWNLFGTGKWIISPVMIEMGPLWHIQVGLILAGHVASVWVAHVIALTLFNTPRRAVLSQLPMLALMMTFTAFGLWILSLPLVSGG